MIQLSFKVTFCYTLVFFGQNSLCNISLRLLRSCLFPAALLASHQETKIFNTVSSAVARIKERLKYFDNKDELKLGALAIPECNSSRYSFSKIRVDRSTGHKV